MKVDQGTRGIYNRPSLKTTVIITFSAPTSDVWGILRGVLLGQKEGLEDRLFFDVLVGGLGEPFGGPKLLEKMTKITNLGIVI